MHVSAQRGFEQRVNKEGCSQRYTELHNTASNHKIHCTDRQHFAELSQWQYPTLKQKPSTASADGHICVLSLSFTAQAFCSQISKLISKRGIRYEALGILAPTAVSKYFKERDMVGHTYTYHTSFLPSISCTPRNQHCRAFRPASSNWQVTTIT